MTAPVQPPPTAPDVTTAEAALVVASARCRDLTSAMYKVRESRRSVGDALAQQLMRGTSTGRGIRAYRRKYLAYQRLDQAHQAALIERRLAQRALAEARDLEAVRS